MSAPIAVIAGAHNTDYSVPGYKLSGGKLVYDRDVTEKDAWENDVYVIGPEERIAQRGCENFQKANCGGSGGGGGSGSSSNMRTEGRRELGGQIKIHNLNTVEHWVSGKLEMRVVVAGGASGGVTLVDFPWKDGVKRKHFKDGNWYNFDAFYFNWRTSSIGNLNIEQWWELDGGKSVASTISIPGQKIGSTGVTSPTTSITFPSEDKDDKLTTAPVQFLDKISEVYGAGNLYFKRN